MPVGRSLPTACACCQVLTDYMCLLSGLHRLRVPQPAGGVELLPNKLHAEGHGLRARCRGVLLVHLLHVASKLGWGGGGDVGGDEVVVDGECEQRSRVPRCQIVYSLTGRTGLTGFDVATPNINSCQIVYSLTGLTGLTGFGVATPDINSCQIVDSLTGLGRLDSVMAC